MALLITVFSFPLFVLALIVFVRWWQNRDQKKAIRQYLNSLRHPVDDGGLKE